MMFFDSSWPQLFDLTFVACNDDEGFANGLFNVSLDLQAEAGVEYHFLIDGFDESTAVAKPYR